MNDWKVKDMSRQIKLGAFLPGGGQHVAAWRHPDQPADGATDLKFHIELAKTAERGLFDAYFLADGLAVAFGGGIEGGNAKVAGFEPVTLFSALAPSPHIWGSSPPPLRLMKSPIRSLASLRRSICFLADVQAGTW
jgi:hypothetical protein